MQPGLKIWLFFVTPAVLCTFFFSGAAAANWITEALLLNLEGHSDLDKWLSRLDPIHVILMLLNHSCWHSALVLELA